MNIEVKIADYLDKEQSIDIGYLLDAYSKDQLGGSQPLSESVRST